METLIIFAAVIGIGYLLINKEKKEQENNTLKENEIILLLESCEKGNGESCFKIGQEYGYLEDGYFGHDPEKSLEFYNKGCKLKNDMSCWFAGSKYRDKGDIDKAIKKYEKAISCGSTWAIDDLAKLYITFKNNPVEGAKVLSVGCDNGENFSCGRVLGYFGDDLDNNSRKDILNYYNQTHPLKCKECRFMQQYIK